MGELGALLFTYRRMVGARIRSDFQYRVSFALFLLSQTVVTAIDFLVIIVIFGQVDALAGWTLEEVDEPTIGLGELTAHAPAIDVEGARVVRVDGPRQWLRFDRASTTAADLVARVAAMVPLRDLSIEEPDIEEIVRRIYREH